MARCFDLGYEIGQADERKRSRERDDLLHRVAEACEEGSDAVTALAREVGVMPEDDAEDLVDEIESWLREQD